MIWSISPRAPSRRSSTTAPTRNTEIIINVYDLLPPGRLSSALWLLGTPLLHSAVVIKDKEYAYGGHEERGLSGVYWTTPRTEPPGARFRSVILHGLTTQTDDEIEKTIQEVSEEFPGTSYNLLNRNCNHFTNALCRRLTSRSAPRWLNRAASIGVALPCVLPREWVTPPDHETAEGQLVVVLDDDENSSNNNDERSMMLLHSKRSEEQYDDNNNNHRLYESSNERANGTSASRAKGWRRHRDRTPEPRNSHLMLRDTSGWPMPPSERAPEL
ncbi:MAG: hypothetical protein M1816_002807 [Peltula sp. TS41687]|nr:MAG: hypothetical protein M1816_002807 [Peltula sp. TS41687]